MLILLGTMSATLSLWRTGETKISADREGRTLQLMFMQDLNNVVMPKSPSLWPRVVTNGSNTFLQFLMLSTSDYQTNAVGDVCFVEYAILPSERRLVRRFTGSGDTFTILKNGSFPSPSTNNAQFVAGALLTDNRQAVRRMNLYNEASLSNFIILDTNLFPISGAYTSNNRPTMIEFNFAAVDSQTATNTALLENENALLPGAALFSFRVALPQPQQ